MQLYCLIADVDSRILLISRSLVIQRFILLPRNADGPGRAIVGRQNPCIQSAGLAHANFVKSQMLNPDFSIILSSLS
jgi:hypothetical protein